MPDKPELEQSLTLANTKIAVLRGQLKSAWEMHDSVNQTNQAIGKKLLEMQEQVRVLREALDKEEKSTRLFDMHGRLILVGNIVHWTDGGDKLSLEERIATRWDRIAVVGKNPDIQFTVIDSPNPDAKRWAHTFNYGNFIYKDTRKYLTIVAQNADEYRELFKNAGECMAWVLKQALAATESKED